MYEDYDDDYLDGLNDELDAYNDEIDVYNDDLNSLEDDVFFLRDEYESEIHEIDEYWDRENEYIKSSGIYTKDEVEQILANHEAIRKDKKREAAKHYQEGLAMLRADRGQILFDREMAEFNRNSVRDEIVSEQLLRGGAAATPRYNDMLRAAQEEQAAYDDFIASLDMK